MSTEDLIDLLDALTALATEARKAGEHTVSLGALRAAYTLALEEL